MVLFTPSASIIARGLAATVASSGSFARAYTIKRALA